jgi:predicted ATPase
VFVGVAARNRGAAGPVRRVERDPGAEWDAGAWWARKSPLGGVLRLVRTPGRRADAYFLRAETAHGLYTYLEGLDRSPDGDLHERSHGEGFLALLERKFARPGFYLLDEPEAALSFTSTLSLMSRLAALADAGAQIVVATHSPVLTALPGATVLELGEHGIRTMAWSDLAVTAGPVSRQS